MTLHPNQMEADHETLIPSTRPVLRLVRDDPDRLRIERGADGALAVSHAVKVAGSRAGVFLAIGILMAGIMAAWATDGFTRIPDWTRFSQWAQTGGRP